MSDGMLVVLDGASLEDGDTLVRRMVHVVETVGEIRGLQAVSAAVEHCVADAIDADEAIAELRDVIENLLLTLGVRAGSSWGALRDVIVEETAVQPDTALMLVGAADMVGLLEQLADLQPLELVERARDAIERALVRSLDGEGD